MPEYRRSAIRGGTFFFTVVSHRRIPMFGSQANVDLLRQCLRATMTAHPFGMDAIVVLPDHLHTIWTLPEGDSDFSMRWRLIKGNFSRHYSTSKAEDISGSRLHKAERGIWQRRFWEHVIRDQEDLNRHLDYIHYSPVKHGLVSSPGEWECSSFLSFVKRGLYAPDWGSGIRNEMLEMDIE